MTTEGGPCSACGHDPADLETAAYDALQAAKNRVIRRQAHIDGYRAAFEDLWTAPLPPNYRASIRALLNAGLPRSAMLDAASIALDADRVPPHRLFAYFAGICWRRARELDGDALERVLRDA